MKLTKIEKKLRADALSLIRFQLFYEVCFLHREPLIDSDMLFLTLLVRWGGGELSQFCEAVAIHLYPDEDEQQRSRRAQNVRNRLVKLERRGIVVKTRQERITTVSLNPAYDVRHRPNTLLNLQLLSVEPV